MHATYYAMLFHITIRQAFLSLSLTCRAAPDTVTCCDMQNDAMQCYVLCAMFCVLFWQKSKRQKWTALCAYWRCETMMMLSARSDE